MRIISKEMLMQAVLQALQSRQHSPGNITKALCQRGFCFPMIANMKKNFAFIAFTFKDPHRKPEKNIMVLHQLLDQLHYPGSSIADNPVVILVFISE